MNGSTNDGPDKAATEEFDSSTAAPTAPAATEAGGAAYTVTIRGREQRRADGRIIEAASPAAALFAALDVIEYPASEPVIEADDSGEVAFVDVDYHTERKPERHRLLSTLINAQPAPVASWATHGGGLRLCYVATGSMRADELAALGAFWMQQNAPTFCGHPTGIEIKRESRHPVYPKKYLTASRRES